MSNLLLQSIAELGHFGVLPTFRQLETSHNPTSGSATSR
jgi:hypothetical protein